MAGLSTSDLISVQVNLSPQATPTENFGSLLILGSSDVIDTDERLRAYSNLTDVGTDLGTDSDEYKAADLYFEQVPEPGGPLYVGKWAQSATSGVLHGGALTVAQQALSNFTAVTTGALDISIDGVTKTLTAINLSSVTNLNGVASAVTTALAGAVCTWNATLNRFDIVSPTTGTSSAVSFSTTPESGTDLGALLHLTSATGAKAVDGIAAETMLSAVQALAAKSNDWYGLAIAADGLQDSDILAVDAYIAGVSPSRFFAVTTQDANALDPTSTTDLAATLAAQKSNHTAVQYSVSSPFAAVSLFARIASVDYSANSSVINLMYKQEPGVTAETLTETQAAALKAKNCNVFVNYSNSTAIIQPGVSSGGQYIDTVIGLDWLANALQVALFNAIYTSATKTPQTDAGVNDLLSVGEGIMTSAVDNGLLAPGVWTGAPIGPVATNQTLPKGFLLFANPVATQSAADRAARKSPPIQALVKLAGAIDTVNAVINVNQ